MIRGREGERNWGRYPGGIKACEGFRDYKVCDACCCKHRALNEWRSGHVSVKQRNIIADPWSHCGVGVVRHGGPQCSHPCSTALVLS
jgi:hypothetical protein